MYISQRLKICYRIYGSSLILLLVAVVYLIHLLQQVCLDVSGNGEISSEKLTRVAREAIDDCNINLTVSGSGGTIRSPNYPDKYPSNADCRWLLTAEDPNAALLLRIDTLQLEPDTDCRLDYLQVHAGSSTLSPPLLDPPLCGDIRDKVIRTNSTELLLVFHSDSVYEDKGFAIDYFTQSAGDCKTSLTDSSSGVIRSPGFPKTYPDNTDCWTLITVKKDKKIALHFDSIDLEYGDNCTFDYVQIFDGATRESPLLGQICKRQDITSFESKTNNLLLHFHSDDSVNKKGYTARYSTIDNQSTVIGDCLWDSGASNGTIASPNYPSHYPSLSNCSIWLRAPQGQHVKIAIEALQLEIEANCSYDYLQIRDGPPHNSTTMGNYCGRKAEPKYLTTTSNEVEIVFFSDGFAEFSGFKLHYTFQKNETDSKQSTFGESPLFESIPVNATIPLGSSHTIRCSTRHPLAKIRWLKNGQFLAGGTPLPGLKVLSNSSLWIQRMDSHLAGVYTCAVVTAEETVSTDAYIWVENGSKNKESSCGIVFRKVPRDISFAEGEFAHLECLAAGTHVRLSWEKDGTPLLRSSHVTILQNGFMFLDKVTLNDTGVYSCVAYDEVAKCSKKASAVLHVSARAKIEEICGRPKAGKPSNDIPSMDQHGKILGGHNTKKGAYPWQVMLWEPTLKSFCGATLLNERWIITAAHCFVNYNGLRWDRIIIKIGKHDREINEPQEFDTSIADPSSIVVHPAYNKVNFDNDLALVRLRDHVPFSDYILPVCLVSRDLDETATPGGSSNLQMGTVAGWGKLKEHGPSPRFLQEIRLPMVDQKICIASTNYTVSRNMFCAGYAQEIVGDACHGDSGGPFMISNDNRWYLFGIVSWGEGCGKAGKYGFYTKVSNYLPWIKGIMKS